MLVQAPWLISIYGGKFLSGTLAEHRYDLRVGMSSKKGNRERCLDPLALPVNGITWG